MRDSSSSSRRNIRRSHGPFQRASARAVLAVFLLTLPGSPPARADFSGDEVVAGDAIVEQRGNLIWIQASDGSIIQFDLLNVWSHEELHARLPDAGSSILLEVLQGPTHVDGGLFSNGTVYLLNPAGIFFGAEAVVDVHGLVAAAGTLRHDDFLAGVDRFELSGVVENAGRIEAPRVALLGTVVANHGDIVAPDGTIALVAGERALLTRLGGHLHVQVDGAAGGPDAPAIEHTGRADAGRGRVSFTTGDVWSVAINHEGITRGRNVELRAEGGTVRVSGHIDASGRRLGATGGDAAVTGERVALVGAEIDASGFAGGGRIRVGGDGRGAGALPVAQRTFVDADSVLRADGILRGDGGEVVVWGEEAAAFHGTLSARGGVLAGRGGFAEISSGGALWSTGDFDLRAPRGATGTLLYDPQDIEIVGGAGDGSDDPDTDPGGIVGDDLGQVLFADVGDGSNPFRIFESEIEGTNANVVLEATHSIASTGDFTNDASGEGEGVLRIVDGNDLTLRTRNDPGDGDGSAATAGIDLTGLDVRTGDGGSVTLETGAGAIAVGAIDTSGADGATGGDAGGIEILAGAPDASGANDVTVEGDLLARGGAGATGDGGAGGAVQLAATGTGAISVGGEIATTGGAGATQGGSGGDVTLGTEDGGITSGRIDASGADGATGGGAGVVDVFAGDDDASVTSDVALLDGLAANGGAGSAGDGGAAGGIGVRSGGATRELVEGDPSTEIVEGGGAIAVGNVEALGGAGSDDGGLGGALVVEVSDGTVATGDLDVSGGDGGAAGGATAGIAVRAFDADQSGDSTVTTGTLTARGGGGGNGAGGAGGVAFAQSFASEEVTVVEDGEVSTIQEALGGGDVTVGAIDTSGGDGTSGGAGGEVTLVAEGQDAQSLDASAGVASHGGSATAGDGGRGGRATAETEDGPLLLGAVDTRGGEGVGVGTVGGSGGAVTVEAGFGEDPTAGDLTLVGNVDAREGGDPGANPSSVEGGDVTLAAAGAVEHAGQAGPHVTTSGDVTFEARDVGAGANGRIVVQGSGEQAEPEEGPFTNDDILTVEASGTARVHSLRAGPDGERAGFEGGLVTRAVDADVDILVTQDDGAGGDDALVQMTGNGTDTVSVDLADTLGETFDLGLALEGSDPEAPEGRLVFATGSTNVGANLRVESEGDIVVGDADGTAIAMSALPGDPGDPTRAGDIRLRADSDGDGLGAVLDAAGAAQGLIDRRGAANTLADEAGVLLVAAGSGIGTADDAFKTSGGEAAFVVHARDPELPAGPMDPLPEPESDAGIHVRNVADGDLVIQDLSSRETGLAGAVVEAGTGDIDIANEVGDLVVEGVVSTRTQVPDERLSLGGDVTLGAAPGGNVVLSTTDAIGSGGQQTYAGAVTLQRNAQLLALGGVDFQGTVDTVMDAFSEAALDVTFEGTAAFRDAVGDAAAGGRALRSLTLTENAEDTGTVLVEADALRTVGAQEYAADVEIGGNGLVTLTSADDRVAFRGDLDAAAGADAPVAITARRVVFEGDVGSDAAPAGLATLAPDGVAFTGEGDQSVTTGAGGILFDTGAGSAPPPAATVWKTGGGLDLKSTGTGETAIRVADGQKLSVQGDLTIEAPAVRVTDLSALSVDVESPDLQVFARASGAVRARDGGLFRDAGTDIVANTVRFSSAPQVVGGGAAPRIATASGTAEGTGALPVTRLPRPVAEADFLSLVGDAVLDLAIPVPDPGNETPELEGGPVEVPQPLRVTDTAAEPGAAPAAAEVAAFLACADVEGPAVRAGCGAPPRAREGSALDTPRARELAAAYRELLGDAPAARAGRDALAAAGPGALATADLPEAGRRYLVEVAHLLARTRLLGLDAATRERLRADLLAAVRDAIGSPALDVAGLEAAVRASRPGLRI